MTHEVRPDTICKAREQQQQQPPTNTSGIMRMRSSFSSCMLLPAACFLILSTFVLDETNAFVVFTPENNVFQLNAKKTKKTQKKNGVKKASLSSTGGFGTSNVAVATKPKKEEDDYAIYPALDKSVMDTLVPTPDSSLVDENSDMMREVYDRISQVHGFPNFNFVVADNNDEETNNGDENSEDEAVSFEDLFLLSNDDDEEVKHEETEKSESTTISSPVDKLPPFNKFHVLHMDPLVLQIDDFFTQEECDKYIQEKATINQDNDDKDDSNKDKDIESISKFKTRSKTVGKDSNAKAQRTSTTWFLNYKDAPELMGKAQRLLGISSSEQGIKVFEEPQAVRYKQTEKFTWHLDALSPDALQNDPNGAGQRVATLLVYLTDLEKGEGGATMFRDLKTEDGEGPLKV